MKNKYYSGSFSIKNINYENIVKDFKVYKIDMDLKMFYGDNITAKERSDFFKSIREIENLNAFYLKGSLFLLGNKKCKAEKYNFSRVYVRGQVQRIGNIEELKKIDKLVLLNLLIKSIPITIFKDENKKEIKYIDNKPLYLFIKEEKNIFRFFKVILERSEFDDNYILNLAQATFTHENYFKKNPNKIAKAVKIGYDPATRVLVPNENGKYYEKSSENKKIESLFISTSKNIVEKYRSYYFTLVKDIVDIYLSKYITLHFENLNEFERYEIDRGKKNYFKKKIIELKKDIYVYRITDYDKNGKELIADDDFLEVKKYLESYVYKNGGKLKKFDGISLIDKGIATIDTKYQKDSWNLFLLNSSTGAGLDYDGYKEIKKKFDIISNGLCLTEFSEYSKDEDKIETLKVVVARIVEELFIKEAIKKRNISEIYKDYDVFKGVSCIHYCDKRIRKIKILSKGKIKVQSSIIYSDDKLNEEFFNLIKKFNLEDKIKKDDKKINSSLNLKFIIINNKDIYIAETGMRLYFDTNEYLEESKLTREKDGFLGVALEIKLNKKENLYYSFYDTGVNSKLKFSPNIKKMVCKEKLTEKEYSIFCESLIFKYLSNGSKLASYPFFFKLTSEIIKNYQD